MKECDDMIKARIHSIETMGLVDGPGIRVVVFMQGCSLRCAYCHNPDTWDTGSGQEITVEELLNKVKRYKGFFSASGGGVTVSGGEPLLQSQFVAQFFRLCREEGIHTTLDTSGYSIGDCYEVLEHTDLVILDVKHVSMEGYKDLTGMDMKGLLKFLHAAQRSGTKIWIRHVVIPGITDGDSHIIKLGEFIKTIPNVEKIELLPYHIHGVNKYKSMGFKYRLENIPPLEEERLEKLYESLNRVLKTDIKKAEVS